MNFSSKVSDPFQFDLVNSLSIKVMCDRNIGLNAATLNIWVLFFMCGLLFTINLTENEAYYVHIEI